MESRVAELYNRFCFPKPECIRFNPYAWQRIDHRLKRFAGVTVLPPKTILVAGCGTTEAVKYALNFPESNVVAIDLSENSIALQKHFADSLKVKNLSFHALSLLQAKSLNLKFDLISSFGVVHHLENPLEGLKALKDVLEPHGLMRLMLYNEEHREPYRKIREAVLSAVSDETSWDTRLEITKKILMLIASFPNRLSRQARENLDYAATDLPVLADTILHPQESAYDVEGLLALVGNAGLKFLSFENGWEWDLKRYFHTSDRSLLEKLNTTEQLSLINGMVAPFFTFYATQDAFKENADKASWLDGIITPAREQAHLIKENGTIGDVVGVSSQILREPGASQDTLAFGSKKVQLTPAIKHLIEKIKKPTPVREVLSSTNDDLFLPLQEMIYTVEYFEILEN
jgi:SAM-dependent methyltransferase